MSRRAELVREAMAEILGSDPGPLELRSMGGGSINQCAHFRAGGETFFLKWNEQPLPHQFEVEAAGLRALRAADSGLVVPEPLAYFDGAAGASFLLLEFVSRGTEVDDFDERLGRGLAALHSCTSRRGFGFEVDGYCGATPQPNLWRRDWVEFYRDARIDFQLKLAKERGMSSRDLEVLHKLSERLGEWIRDREEPSLIHGDLWSGNLHVAGDGSPCILDPAAYYGHREAELGMMHLFGGFRRRVWDAYEEATPLREGWRERLDLYALYHVLNHYNLFGGGYGSQAVRIGRRYLS